MRVKDIENIPIDFCRKCLRDWVEHIEQQIVEANNRIRSCPWAGEMEFGEEEDYDVDCEHPDYEEMGYECEACGQKLTKRD